MVLLWIFTTELITLIYTLFIIRLTQLSNAVKITVDDLQVVLVVDLISRAAALSLPLVWDGQQSNEPGLTLHILRKADLPARHCGDDLK